MREKTILVLQLKLLNWKPKISFNELVEEMVEHDMKIAKLELSNQSPV